MNWRALIGLPLSPLLEQPRIAAHRARVEGEPGMTLATGWYVAMQAKDLPRERRARGLALFGRTLVASCVGAALALSVSREMASAMELSLVSSMRSNSIASVLPCAHKARTTPRRT